MTGEAISRLRGSVTVLAVLDTKTDASKSERYCKASLGTLKDLTQVHDLKQDQDLIQDKAPNKRMQGTRRDKTRTHAKGSLMVLLSVTILYPGKTCLAQNEN